MILRFYNSKYVPCSMSVPQKYDGKNKVQRKVTNNEKGFEKQVLQCGETYEGEVYEGQDWMVAWIECMCR